MIFYLEILLILDKKKIFDIYKSDNIVLIASVVNGDSGVHILFKSSHNLAVIGIRAYAAHINSRYHNIFCQSIAEIKYVVDDLFLSALNDTVLMAYVNVSLELVLGHGLSACRIDSEELKYRRRYAVYHKGKRLHHGHYKNNASGVPKCHVLRISGGNRLGNDLT